MCRAKPHKKRCGMQPERQNLMLQVLRFVLLAVAG
jgi:hypothetical protein